MKTYWKKHIAFILAVLCVLGTLSIGTVFAYNRQDDIDDGYNGGEASKSEGVYEGSVSGCQLYTDGIPKTPAGAGDTYTVTWMYEDEVLRTNSEVPEGGTDTYTDEGMTEDPENFDYSYAFRGWSTDRYALETLIPANTTGVYQSEAIYEDTTYYAIYNTLPPDGPGGPGTWTVEWYSDDELLQTAPITEGSTDTYIGTPEKQDDDEYSYTFIGWDTDPEATEPMIPVNEENTYESEIVFSFLTYYAIYSKTPIEAETYTVVWRNGDVTLKSSEVENGSLDIYDGLPAKAADATYTYTFIGWDTDPEATDPMIPVSDSHHYLSQDINQDTTYYAIYSKTLIPVETYTMVWRNGDVTLKSSEINENEGDTYEGLPVKAADATYTYTFIGWDTDPESTEPMIPVNEENTYESEAITQDTTYYAIYSKTLIPVETYTMVWRNGNVTLKSSEINENEGDTYEGLPVKAADATYTYTFIGWDTDPEATEPMIPVNEENTYESEAITENTIYYAIYSKEPIQRPGPVTQFTVKWVVDGKNYTELYNEGAVPTFKGSTDKATDSAYSYKFIGWNPAVGAVTGDVTYTAQYEKIPVNSPKTGDESHVNVWLFVAIFSLCGLGAFVWNRKKLLLK